MKTTNAIFVFLLVLLLTMYTLLLDPIIGSLCARWPADYHILYPLNICCTICIILFYLLYLPATKWISGLNEMGGIWNQIGPKPIFFYGHLDFITFCAAHLET